MHGNSVSLRCSSQIPVFWYTTCGICYSPMFTDSQVTFLESRLTFGVLLFSQRPIFIATFGDLLLSVIVTLGNVQCQIAE